MKGAPVVQWQILSPKSAEVSQFYGTVFGWTEKRDNAIGYRQINTGSDAGIQGGIWPAPPEAPTMVQLFVEVADVDATIASFTGQGGSILVPKSALPDGEVMAIVKDPFGMSVGLLQAGRNVAGKPASEV